MHHCFCQIDLIEPIWWKKAELKYKRTMALFPPDYAILMQSAVILSAVHIYHRMTLVLKPLQETQKEIDNLK